MRTFPLFCALAVLAATPALADEPKIKTYRLEIPRPGPHGNLSPAGQARDRRQGGPPYRIKHLYEGAGAPGGREAEKVCAAICAGEGNGKGEAVMPLLRRLKPRG